ncbi:MAG: hypothetical protein JO208_04820 [Alphaproteobacteria bacterium]|nr:hypothetical protein [Alphaproteobacteria bacterium]
MISPDIDRRTFAALLMSTAVATPVRFAQAGNTLSIRMDYAGAEALLAAVQRRDITDTGIDRLLSIRGVRAMVANTTKYLPKDTAEVFRAALKEFITTGKVTHGHFGLSGIAAHEADARAAIAALRSDVTLATEITAPIKPYQPATGPLIATIYCVAGGASDGFVLDGDPEPAFFMAIDRSKGDVNGAKLNMTHELYHVAQRAARGRAPNPALRGFNQSSGTPPVRLLTTVLEEGTAVYVAEPMLAHGSGPYISEWRAGYAKNKPASSIAANFALFDHLLANLTAGSMKWETAYEKGFSNRAPPLYFVGYEMTKALDRAYGHARIGAYFQEHPATFFKDYIALYRERPDAVRARFSVEMERTISSFG